LNFHLKTPAKFHPKMASAAVSQKNSCCPTQGSQKRAKSSKNQSGKKVFQKLERKQNVCSLPEQTETSADPNVEPGEAISVSDEQNFEEEANLDRETEISADEQDIIRSFIERACEFGIRPEIAATMYEGFIFHTSSERQIHLYFDEISRHRDSDGTETGKALWELGFTEQKAAELSESIDGSPVKDHRTVADFAHMYIQELFRYRHDLPVTHSLPPLDAGRTHTYNETYETSSKGKDIPISYQIFKKKGIKDAAQFLTENPGANIFFFIF
jgi:hypothetical protein